MSIENKISKGEWRAEGHHVRTDNRPGGIGQSFVAEVGTHENKFKRDSEGEANAKLFAASKDMYKALMKIKTDFTNASPRPNEWMAKRLNEIESVFEKHNL